MHIPGILYVWRNRSLSSLAIYFFFWKLWPTREPTMATCRWLTCDSGGENVPVYVFKILAQFHLSTFPYVQSCSIPKFLGLSSRVTRLGEFSPVGWWLSLGQIVLNYRSSANSWANFFQEISYVFVLTYNGLGYFLGDFFHFFTLHVHRLLKDFCGLFFNNLSTTLDIKLSSINRNIYTACT
jgi:hypothetical protein